MNQYVDIFSSLRITYINGRLDTVKVLVGLSHLESKIIEAERWENNLDPKIWIQEKVSPAKSKIALWCKAYEAYTAQLGEGINYKVSAAEAGLLKNLEVTQELLYVFFTTDFWTKAKNISNYNKHYNEIRRIKITGQYPNKGNGSGSSQKGDESLAEALQKRYGKSTDAND